MFIVPKINDGGDTGTIESLNGEDDRFGLGSCEDYVVVQGD